MNSLVQHLHSTLCNDFVFETQACKVWIKLLRNHSAMISLVYTSCSYISLADGEGPTSPRFSHMSNASVSALSSARLILEHLSPGLWGQSSEWVGGRKMGDWGSKSTCFGVWCSEPQSIWFCCVYTIRPAGEDQSTLAKRNCSLSLFASVQLSLSSQSHSL